jgi:hypothetical protein
MFLIVADRRNGTTQVDDLGSDVAAAMNVYRDSEHEFADRDDVEVVLVSSTSLETLRSTHSSYFGASVAPALAR